MIENTKYKTLFENLKKLKKVAVAFSGGVDSSFLLAVAKEALGEQAIGITVDSPALPRYELDDAKNIARHIHVKHIIISSNEIEDEVKKNPEDRCYHCKKIEFGSIKQEAAMHGITHVLDGSNTDDLKDYRPGMTAVKEIHVLSPLLEAGFTKAEIREFSKKLNLPTWDKPAYACLYSRIPYGQEIKREDLKKVELSEKFLIDHGFRIVRVRCHGDVARIEVAKEERFKLIEEPFAFELSTNLKSFGFKYITLDLEGYRMGSLNSI